MFIPGFGAYVRWNAAGVTEQTRALVSLASFSAFINLINLIPVWTLDGGQAVDEFNRGRSARWVRRQMSIAVLPNHRAAVGQAAASA